MCSLAGLRAVERLEDARFALAHRARVYDASRVLLRSRCPGGAAFADDRRRALSALERHVRAASFRRQAGRALHLRRAWRCFRASRSEWVAVVNYICECTLGRCVGGGVDGRREDGGEGAVTDAEVVDRLGILTLLFFLHRPALRGFRWTCVSSPFLELRAARVRAWYARERSRSDCVLPW